MMADVWNLVGTSASESYLQIRRNLQKMNQNVNIERKKNIFSRGDTN